MRRLLHFGPGNFFRAHLAEYVFDAGGWEIVTVSLRSTVMPEHLAYTLAVQGQDAKRIDVIGAHVPARSDPGRVLDVLQDPAVEVVSATVTEKGYCLGTDGRLDLSHPDIRMDLETGTPQTLIGFLTHGLATRRAPVTVLSCDNRTGNGDALGAAIGAFAAAAGLKLSCDVAFPNAMVDRITPATTEAMRSEFWDAQVVPCEPFKEWVLEDAWATLRPDWPGVRWVADVAPHEMRKLRMLNGAHSYLAYAGVLGGHTYVHEAIADPVLRAGALALMAEAEATLPRAAEADGYAEALVVRFENPHLNHALRQIAMDGTQKLPYRIVETLRARGTDASPALTAALAAWIGFCRAETAAGRVLQDPRAEALARARADREYLALIGL